MREGKEGEFKKRINEKSESVDARCGSVIAVPILYEMIEDAKKEFPPYAQKKLHDLRYECGWKMADLKKWFEKWFGE